VSPSWLLVVVHDAGARARPVHDLVGLAVGELGVGDPRGLVRHHCPTCGSSGHGRPWLAGVPGEPEVHLSIARCQGRSVVAITDAGPIGVDVETSGAALSRDVEEVLGADHPGDATRRWVRAEALLKAADRGLARSGATDPFAGPAWTTDLDLGPGYQAALAVLTPATDPEVRVIRAGAGAPSC
jgi:4'-phosphopantetheinyl transferase